MIFEACSCWQYCSLGLDIRPHSCAERQLSDKTNGELIHCIRLPASGISHTMHDSRRWQCCMQLVFESTSHTLVGKSDLPYKPAIPREIRTPTAMWLMRCAPREMHNHGFHCIACIYLPLARKEYREESKPDSTSLGISTSYSMPVAFQHSNTSSEPQGLFSPSMGQKGASCNTPWLRRDDKNVSMGQASSWYGMQTSYACLLTTRSVTESDELGSYQIREVECSVLCTRGNRR